MDVDSETDNNRDTALTLACAGGHEELVELLLSRKAAIGKNNGCNKKIIMYCNCKCNLKKQCEDLIIQINL